MQDLAEGFQNNKRLSILKVWGCRVGDTGAMAVAHSLRLNNAALSMLFIGGSPCHIGRPGADQILQALGHNSALVSVDLTGCNKVIQH